jgi:hypothetical protein
MRHPTTVCFAYFKSLTLAHLEASLLTLAMQDPSNVDEILILDNDTTDPTDDIRRVVDMLRFPVPVKFISIKHGDPTATHAWSTNQLVYGARSRWVFFTRADYLLEADALSSMLDVVARHTPEWDGFVTGDCYHLNPDLTECDAHEWRERGVGCLRHLPGALADYTKIDSGVWLGRTESFRRVEGLDERLSAWGHAQTHFQHKLYQSGTEFVKVPRVLFYHPRHAAPRDLAVAHAQLAEVGADLRAMWDRHEGVNPYR